MKNLLGETVMNVRYSVLSPVGIFYPLDQRIGSGGRRLILEVQEEVLLYKTTQN
mgnify:CR=1 FL=1